MIQGIKALFSKKSKVVTRFAPSPTGLLHAGSYRTAVFSYIFAKQNEGRFVLRIEDTDTIRSKKEYEDNILDSLTWLALPYDEMHRQSERTAIYKEYLEKLLADGKAYLSKEEPAAADEQPKKAGAKDAPRRTEVIRFKNPNKKVRFHDLIRGDIEFDTTELGDFVIAKSVTEPIFHLAVVLDDYLMGITHIIRGDDHISNTPRQILIQRALGAPEPVYAHIPLLLAPDRSKLSKRHGALPLTEYRERGYLPEAMVNFLALLGWNPGTAQELFAMDELIAEFDFDRVQKSGAIFNEEKLKWMNKEYLKRKPAAFITALVAGAIGKPESAVTPAVAAVIMERASTAPEIKALYEAGEYRYFFEKPQYDAAKLLWKDEKDAARTRGHLEFALAAVEKLPAGAAFTQAAVKEALWPYAEQNGRGNVLWPMRFSLSGAQKSPDPFALSELLGREETLARLKIAIDKLK